MKRNWICKTLWLPEGYNVISKTFRLKMWSEMRLFSRCAIRRTLDFIPNRFLFIKWIDESMSHAQRQTWRALDSSQNLPSSWTYRENETFPSCHPQNSPGHIVREWLSDTSCCRWAFVKFISDSENIQKYCSFNCFHKYYALTIIRCSTPPPPTPPPLNLFSHMVAYMILEQYLYNTEQLCVFSAFSLKFILIPFLS